MLAGVDPVRGLYTLMMGVPVGALFTGSVFMNVSTTSALSVAAGSALAAVPSQSLRFIILTLSRTRFSKASYLIALLGGTLLADAQAWLEKSPIIKKA